MIRINGMDDDTVQIDTDNGSVNVPLPIRESVIVTASSEDGGVEVSIWFEGPWWAFSIMQLPGEDVEVPWTVTFDQESSYSMVAEIQCPEDTSWEYTTEPQ